MGLPIDAKLNLLLRKLPEGVAAPSSWLAAQGYSRQLVHKYVQNGWLEALARGAFCRPPRKVRAEGVVLGLQWLGGWAVHVGGLSALERLGHAHYLALSGVAALHLWGARPLPAWVRAVPSEQRIVFHGRRLFNERADAIGLVNLPTGVRDWTLTISGAERAIVEMFSLVDDTEAEFTHAAEVFEGLSVLRPDVVNSLLAACISLKAKRLFLFLASRLDYPWTRHIDRGAIDLGAGKRSIVRGGRYVPEFRITVPERFRADR